MGGAAFAGLPPAARTNDATGLSYVGGRPLDASPTTMIAPKMAPAANKALPSRSPAELAPVPR